MFSRPVIISILLASSLIGVHAFSISNREGIQSRRKEGSGKSDQSFLAAGTNHMTDAFWSTGRDKNREENRSRPNRVFDSVLLDNGKKGVKHYQDNKHRSNTFYDSRNYVEDGANYGQNAKKNRRKENYRNRKDSQQYKYYSETHPDQPQGKIGDWVRNPNGQVVSNDRYLGKDLTRKGSRTFSDRHYRSYDSVNRQDSFHRQNMDDSSRSAYRRRDLNYDYPYGNAFGEEQIYYYYYDPDVDSLSLGFNSHDHHQMDDNQITDDVLMYNNDDDENIHVREKKTNPFETSKMIFEEEPDALERDNSLSSEEEKVRQVSPKSDNMKTMKLEQQTTNDISYSSKTTTTKDIEVKKEKETLEKLTADPKIDTAPVTTATSKAMSQSPLTISTVISQSPVTTSTTMLESSLTTSTTTSQSPQTNQRNGLNKEQEETIKERFQNQVDDYQSVKPDIIAYKISVSNIGQNETKASNDTVEETTSNLETVSQKLIEDVTEQTTTLKDGEDESKPATHSDITTQSSDKKLEIQDSEESQVNENSEIPNFQSTGSLNSSDSTDTTKTITLSKLQTYNRSSDSEKQSVEEKQKRVDSKEIIDVVSEKVDDFQEKPDSFKSFNKNDFQGTKSINGVAAAMTPQFPDLKNAIDTLEPKTDNMNSTRNTNSTTKSMESNEGSKSIVKVNVTDSTRDILTTTLSSLTNTTEYIATTGTISSGVSSSSWTDNSKTSTFPIQDSQNSKNPPSTDSSSIQPNSDFMGSTTEKSNITLEHSNMPSNSNKSDTTLKPPTTSSAQGAISTPTQSLNKKSTYIANTNSSTHGNSTVKSTSAVISNSNISFSNTNERMDNSRDINLNGENKFSNNSNSEIIHQDETTTSKLTDKISANNTDNIKKYDIAIDRDIVLNQTETHPSSLETQKNTTDLSTQPPSEPYKAWPIKSPDEKGINSPASMSQGVDMGISLNKTRDTRAKHSTRPSDKVSSFPTTTSATEVHDGIAGSEAIPNTSPPPETDSPNRSMSTTKPILNSNPTTDTNQQDTTTNSNTSTKQSTLRYEISSQENFMSVANVSQANKSNAQNDKSIEPPKIDNVKPSDDFQSAKEKEIGIISHNSTESKTPSDKETNDSDQSENEHNFNEDKNETKYDINGTSPKTADEKGEDVNVKEHNITMPSSTNEFVTNDTSSPSPSNKLIAVSAVASISKSDNENESNPTIQSLKPITTESSTQRAQGITDISKTTEVNVSQSDLKVPDTEVTKEPMPNENSSGSPGPAVDPSFTTSPNNSLASILSSESIRTNASTENKTVFDRPSRNENISSFPESPRKNAILVSNNTFSTQSSVTAKDVAMEYSLVEETAETNSSDFHEKGDLGASKRKGASVDGRNGTSSSGIPPSFGNLNDTEYEEIEIPETSAYMIQDFSLKRDDYLTSDNAPKADTVDVDPQNNKTAKDCPPSVASGPCPAMPPPAPPRSQAAMSAVLTSHFGPTKEQIIPFDLELLDLADNYDNTTGMFICTIPGTYVISLYLMSHPGAKVNARVFINNRPVAALWADDAKNAGFYPSGSIQTIVQLGFGDQVYVMLVDGGYGDSWVHANYNVFTVFLLYEQVFK